MIVNDKLGRMYKKLVMAYFEVLTQHLPKGTEENKEPQDGWSPGWDSNLRHLVSFLHILENEMAVAP